MSMVLLDSSAKQNGLCKLESKPWRGRIFHAKFDLPEGGKILDQSLNQF